MVVEDNSELYDVDGEKEEEKEEVEDEEEEEEEEDEDEEGRGGEESIAVLAVMVGAPDEAVVVLLPPHLLP